MQGESNAFEQMKTKQSLMHVRSKKNKSCVRVHILVRWPVFIGVRTASCLRNERSVFEINATVCLK